MLILFWSSKTVQHSAGIRHRRIKNRSRKTGAFSENEKRLVPDGTRVGLSHDCTSTMLFLFYLFREKERESLVSDLTPAAGKHNISHRHTHKAYTKLCQSPSVEAPNYIWRHAAFKFTILPLAYSQTLWGQDQIQHWICIGKDVSSLPTKVPFMFMGIVLWTWVIVDCLYFFHFEYSLFFYTDELYSYYS